MQAPTTTEGGIGGHDPRVRSCASCGAENVLPATFCWRCFRVFETSGAPAAPWPSRPDLLPPRAVGNATRVRSRSVGQLAVVVAVTLGVVATIAYLSLRASEVSFPTSFGGLDRIEGTQTDLAADVFRASSEAAGMDADMAFYGSGADPVAALMWIRGAERTPGGPDEVFDAFADGFASGNNGTVVTGERDVQVVEGVTYVCAPVAGALPAAICLWEQDEVFWVLLDVRPGEGLSATRDLAVAARDAAA